ncbi:MULTISPECIES: TRAP transporter small permease [Aminobacterium]|jgi:TRAP-type C4-dicarboxylate transport system permease small subunit|uniref:TRAP transporter small permease n=1 Tax=Aminobacterium TaxID=81466 RepID=UPI0025799A48|nr:MULTISPECIES: TRAP transporter small permease [unclassified Aminobacterium]
MLKKIWDHFEEVVGSVMLMIMVSVAFLNVVTRYFIKYSLSFTEELEVNLFVWLVMLGTSLAFRKGANLSMTFFYERFSEKKRAFFFLCSSVATMLFFGILAYLGYIEVVDEIALNVTTESLDIPVWIYTIATPVFSVLIIIRMAQYTLEAYKNHQY